MVALADLRRSNVPLPAGAAKRSAALGAVMGPGRDSGIGAGKAAMMCPLGGGR
jgi:hypothetical protein